MNTQDTAEIVGAYHDAWTSKDYARARALLAGTLAVEVPVNDYPTTESFAAALRSFGSMVTKVDLLASMTSGREAMLLYDLDVERLGRLRVAEHFTVDQGKITRIRQIHDTAAVRAAGLAG
jgi:ketosteroid isomerase-like protein